jgi:hypothetical protein
LFISTKTIGRKQLPFAGNGEADLNCGIPIDLMGERSYNPDNKAKGESLMGHLFERLLRINFRFGRMCFLSDRKENEFV